MAKPNDNMNTPKTPAEAARYQSNYERLKANYLQDWIACEEVLTLAGIDMEPTEYGGKTIEDGIEALKAERDELKAKLFAWDAHDLIHRETLDKLAESQAREAKLREACKEAYSVFFDPSEDDPSPNTLGWFAVEKLRQALSTPPPPVVSMDDAKCTPCGGTGQIHTTEWPALYDVCPDCQNDSSEDTTNENRAVDLPRFVRFCTDCRFCVMPDPKFDTGWQCSAPLANLLSGKTIRPNGDMPAWAARLQYCGTAAVWFEPKKEFIQNPSQRTTL